MEEELIEQLDEQFSEDEDQSRSAHKKMLGAVTQLYEKKRVKAPTRKEPSLEVSEFHLSLPEKKRQSRVRVTDLAKVLNKRALHTNISQKLKTAHKRAKTLPKPLEKIHSDQIARAAGYEHARQQLNRWDAIVYKNTVAEQLEFPLKGDTVRVQKDNDLSKLFRKPTEMEMKLAEILKHSDPLADKKKEENENNALELEKTEEYPLSLAEIIEKRKMMAKLRAKESYRQAKAARHKKIKSKKFRQIQRKARAKEQLKEFEELQKKDPEAALKKLEELERARAEERVSLRHRSTGQWAKNLAIRAKYDKEARIALSEQLSKSRELTIKLAQNRESESEKEDEEEVLPEPAEEDPDNPWVVKRSNEMTAFLSGYRKYWENKEKEGREDSVIDSAVKVNQKPNQDEVSTIESHVPFVENKDNEEIEINENAKNKTNADQLQLSPSKNSFTVMDSSCSEGSKTNIGLCNSAFKCTQNTKSNKTANKSRKLKESISISNKSEIGSATGPWKVSKGQNLSSKKFAISKRKSLLEKRLGESFQITKTKTVLKPLFLDNNSLDEPSMHTELLENKNKGVKEKNLDELFEEVEDNLQSHVRKQVEKIKRKLNSRRKPDDTDIVESESEIDTPNLEMKKSKVVADVDAQLLEMPGKFVDATGNNDVLTKIKTSTSAEVKQSDDIDPKNFLKVTPRHLSSKVPEIMAEGEDLDDEMTPAEQRFLTLTEAYAEDDIVDQFNKEKVEEVKKNKISDVDLSLPGWGSWAGHNMKPISRRKRKKFVIKFPKAIPRRDSNRGNVIINEDADKPIKEHQVSEVPHPFTSVKEYEASIRAPLGTTWLPQKAHRKLTMPSVVTKLGTVIEPMDESQLVNRDTKTPTNKKLKRK